MIHNHEQSTRVATGTLLAAILIFSSLCPALASKLSNESGNVSTLKHVAVITIQGHVTDEAGNPVSGARLNVKWAERVSVSDQNGEFKIENLTEKDTIVVTHSYYQMVQFALEKSKTNYFISMKKAATLAAKSRTSTPNGEALRKNPIPLDELVIVGFGNDGHRPRNKPLQPSEEQRTIAEQNPEFPGGIDALYSFLAKNIKYPKEASDDNWSGKVFVSFTVNEKGEIRKPQIIKGLGYGIDEEVLRVILNMPKWNPAIQNGRFVSKEFVLPLAFTLE